MVACRLRVRLSAAASLSTNPLFLLGFQGKVKHAIRAKGPGAVGSALAGQDRDFGHEPSPRADRRLRARRLCRIAPQGGPLAPEPVHIRPDRAIGFCPFFRFEMLFYKDLRRSVSHVGHQAVRELLAFSGAP